MTLLIILRSFPAWSRRVTGTTVKSSMKEARQSLLGGTASEESYSVGVPPGLKAAPAWRGSGGMHSRWRDELPLSSRIKHRKGLICGLIFLLSMVWTCLRSPFVSSILGRNKLGNNYGWEALSCLPASSPSIVRPSPEVRKKDSSRMLNLRSSLF